jgi:hypothetical protein
MEKMLREEVTREEPFYIVSQVNSNNSTYMYLLLIPLCSEHRNL